MLPACQRYCDHYQLGVAHGRQGLTLEEVHRRDIRPKVIQPTKDPPLPGFVTPSCTCYLDGLSDGRDGSIDPSGEYGGRCDCYNTTIEIKITRTF